MKFFKNCIRIELQVFGALPTSSDVATLTDFCEQAFKLKVVLVILVSIVTCRNKKKIFIIYSLVLINIFQDCNIYNTHI